MAFDLLTPVYNQLPKFQPNQVLTYNHLNEVVDYLYQQERYTRNKLIGNGIVCGLSFQWQTLAAPNAQVIIEDGVAVTSAGYLVIFQQPRTQNGTIIPYTHRRNFTRLDKFIPFDDSAVYNGETIFELITLDEFNADSVSLSKTILLETDRTNMVLVLLFDPEVKDVAKCLDESCDDKGKIYLFTPRPLLIPIAVLNNILNAANNKKYWTEEGRGWKAINSRLQGANLDFANVPNLFTNYDLQTINTPPGIQNLFKSKLQNADLDLIRFRINALLNEFPWMFTTAIDALKLAEMPALTLPPAANLGDQFKAKAINFRDTFNANYIQYLYDFIRDVTDAYNELYLEATSLVSECGGNEWRNPFHIMLGKAQPNPDSIMPYEENKYLLPGPQNFKYRHYFIPSPVMDEQFMLYEKVQQLLKRLVRLINNFGVNPDDTTIKISPSRDYDKDLGIRAIPYYYTLAGTPLIQNVWNYQSTFRNKAGRHKGYQLVGNTPADQATLLNTDTCKNDFYRIEGHINTAVVLALTTIDELREQYNLPFTTATVSVQKSGSSMQISCSFPDLEEDFNYYRDRVLGYLREYIYQLEVLSGTPLVAEILKLLSMLAGLLVEVRCIENFDYNKYKEVYKTIYEVVLSYLAVQLTNNTNNANQQFNIASNILNIIFFRPLYKIWYAYKYRITLIQASEIDSINSLYGKYTGLEHLAGVRRGETFLLVYDSTNNNVIADFDIPDLLGCSCDCKTEACDGKHRTLVSPLQKPVIMVVDFTVQKPRNRNKAFWVAADNVFRLELDSMGFYKADSDIKPEILITDDQGGKNVNPILTGVYISGPMGGEIFRLDYKFTNEPKYGVHRLFYHLEGDFDEHKVTGMIILVIMGKLTFNDLHKADVIIGAKPKPEYPYKPSDYKGEKLELRFVDPYTMKTIGNKSIPVYSTAAGNEVGIFTDAKGYAYFKSEKATTPAIEEFNYTIEANGNAVPAKMIWNVIDMASKPANTKYNGRVLQTDGSPVPNAKVRMGNKEVFTNEKGEYSFTGIKPGGAIEIEKEGYKKELVQVNSNLAADTNLSRKPVVGVTGVDLGKVPAIAEITKNLKLADLKNIFNK